MNVSVSDVAKAEKFALEQRVANLAFLRVDEAAAVTADEAKIRDHVRKIAAEDPIRIDKALAHPVVEALFQRGVLFFERK